MAGSVAGAFFSGDKPKIPDYPTINFLEEQVGAIQGNIASMPSLRKLTMQVDDFNSDQMLRQLEKMFPGYSQILAKGTETLQSQMRGEIPEDVRRAVGRNAAERSRAGGYAGSEFGGALEARDLGLTSLGIINQSLGTADRWMARAHSATPRFDFTSMFISPQQRIQVKLYENQQKFQRDLMKARVDAMPEPWETALKNFFDNVEESGQAALGAYAGMQMGGGGQSGAKLGSQMSQMGNSSGNRQGWAYEGSTNFESAPAPQIENAPPYYEEPVQSYDLPPQYDYPTHDPYNAPPWGG